MRLLLLMKAKSNAVYNMSMYRIETTNATGDYELLDSGDGEKLERYVKIMIARPDPQALWHKLLPDATWKKADAYFKREKAVTRGDGSSSGRDAGWQTRFVVPDRWEIGFDKLRFLIKLSPFKHTGLFPEQASNWDWIREKIKSAKRTVQVLNLFGYTGGATLAAAQVGAEVCHLDGSKTAIGWARDNATASGLAAKPIRWILDDARKFVEREIKRGRRYDGIIMDPPAFGHGPNGEVWKIEEDFPKLLEVCREALSDKPLFFLINGYASGYSALAYKNNLLGVMKGYEGTIEVGELTIGESQSDRLLPCGIFARWSAN